MFVKMCHNRKLISDDKIRAIGGLETQEDAHPFLVSIMYSLTIDFSALVLSLSSLEFVMVCNCFRTYFTLLFLPYYLCQ
jgi:hypothetical protein